MKLKKLHIIGTILVAGIGITTLSSNSGGITGRSTVGCGGCHGAASTSSTVIGLAGIPTTGWVPGTSYPLTLTVTNPAKVKAGFNLTVNVGTLTAGSGSTSTGTELRHTSAQNFTSAGTATWSFTWVAPASGSTPLTVNIAGNAVNGNGGPDAGDNWNLNTLNFTAAAAVTAPTATASAATAINPTTATANGSVTANGASTAVSFEYGLTTSYGSTVNATPGTVTGTAATPVTGSLTGLTPNTLYHYRVTAVNSAGTTNSADQTFTTSAPAPVVPVITNTGATASGTVNGTVNAGGASTTVTVEYGLTTSYGSTVNATPLIVTGTAATPVTGLLTGLAPNTLYHYRFKAVNSAGTTFGSDTTFTTTNLSIGTLNEGGFTIFPNPAKSLLTLTAKNAANVILYATSLTGTVTALPYTRVSADQYQVNIANLAAGNYLLVLNAGGKTFASPFVKL